MSAAPPNRTAAPQRPFTGFLRHGVSLPSVARRSRRRRRLVRTLLLIGALVVVLVVVVLSGGSSPKATAGDVTARATLAASVTVPDTPPSTAATPGTAATPPSAATPGTAATPPTAVAPPSGIGATLPWPATGQSAVAVPAVGFTAQSGSEKAVPVASLTKIMTAYVILRDHPLSPGEPGPKLTITTADADNFGMDTVTDQASVELKAGEVLTEYQLLEGLLVHSANDFAYVLAMWDAGSMNAFVAKMNAEAGALGMRNSHFADASGFDAGSTSTAADMLLLASRAMTQPVFAAIVQMPSVTLPVAGTVESYTPLVGTTPGVVGVKSGFTTAAGGSDVLAYQTTVGGLSFVTLAAVTEQEGPTVLERAGMAALALAKAMSSHVERYTATTADRPVGRVMATGHSVKATTAAAAHLLAIAGDSVRQQVVLHPPKVGAPAGTTVGTASFRLGDQAATVRVKTAARIP